jgi:hypothetical protein
MRVNIYAEELTDRVEIIEKVVEGHTYTAVRFYLELPVTLPAEHVIQDGCMGIQEGVRPARNVRGPFLHRPGDDDSSAVTFWGKRDLRKLLVKALALLDDHASKGGAPR